MLNEIHVSSFKKMHSKMSSAKCRPSCLDLNVLTENEEHDIPSQVLKTIFGLHASVILGPNMCGF